MIKVPRLIQNVRIHPNEGECAQYDLRRVLVTEYEEEGVQARFQCWSDKARAWRTVKHVDFEDRDFALAVMWSAAHLVEFTTPFQKRSTE